LFDKLAHKGSDIEIDKLCSAQREALLVYRTQAGEGLDGVLEVRRGSEEMVPLQTVSDGGTRMFSINLDGWPGPQFRDARPHSNFACTSELMA
jgi:hypothetical protein